MQQLKGVGVALVTPFNTDCTIDYTALSKVIEFTIAGGVDYIVTLGTTGEAATLSETEQQEILDFTVEKIQGRCPIVLGLGGNDTASLLKKLHTWNLEPVDAILSVSPYYSKPSQEGIYKHYEAIAESSPKPVILYNVPGRTSANITADTSIRLANDFNGKIIGIKEASGNMSQAMHLGKNRPKDFLLISGDDHLTLPLISLGFDGVISVAANSFPLEYCSLVNYALKGNFVEATKLQFHLLERLDLLFLENNPAGVKAFLAAKGIIENVLRLPLIPISQQWMDKISKWS